MFVSQQSDCLIVKNSYIRDEVLFKLSWNYNHLLSLGTVK